MSSAIEKHADLIIVAGKVEKLLMLRVMCGYSVQTILEPTVGVT